MMPQDEKKTCNHTITSTKINFIAIITCIIFGHSSITSRPEATAEVTEVDIAFAAVLGTDWPPEPESEIPALMLRESPEKLCFWFDAAAKGIFWLSKASATEENV